MYKIIILCLLYLLNMLLSFRTATAEMMKEESLKYSVTVTSIENSRKYKKAITLHVLNRKSNVVREILVANRTVKIIDLYPLDTGHLVVHGELGSGGDILTIIDMESGEIVDTIWGWKASISPDMTKIAYNFRYPPHSIPLYRTSVLLMYDLTKSPEENSMDDSKDNPENRGFILWPKENRIQKRYFIPAMSYEEQRHISSPIVWNKKSDKICFLMRQGNQKDKKGLTYLMIINISNGLLEPHTTLQEVDTTLFYREKALKSANEKDIDRTMAAEELRFSDDDQAVEIRAYNTGPFDGEKKVKIKIKK